MSPMKQKHTLLCLPEVEVGGDGFGGFFDGNNGGGVSDGAEIVPVVLGGVQYEHGVDAGFEVVQ